LDGWTTVKIGKRLKNETNPCKIRSYCIQVGDGRTVSDGVPGRIWFVERLPSLAHSLTLMKKNLLYILIHTTCYAILLWTSWNRLICHPFDQKNKRTGEQKVVLVFTVSESVLAPVPSLALNTGRDRGMCTWKERG